MGGEGLAVPYPEEGPQTLSCPYVSHSIGRGWLSQAVLRSVDDSKMLTQLVTSCIISNAGSTLDI